MRCVFPEPFGSYWNTEEGVKGHAGEIMAANPGCPVKVGVSHNRKARMSGWDYPWAGECHVVAMEIQDNVTASKLESRGIYSAVAHYDRRNVRG